MNGPAEHIRRLELDLADILYECRLAWGTHIEVPQASAELQASASRAEILRWQIQELHRIYRAGPADRQER